MNYIETVVLENFQSHKNSTIEFDNGLNVIVGPSDSGKTAILRAIKWALYNEPSGDYFIREGETECSVSIIFSDGTNIKRYRSKSKNIYYLWDSNNIETKFEGFGTTVPQEIIDKIGIEKILLDNDQSRAINFSDQLEGAFLLSERGSLRANSIGRLVGVNIIDDSLKETLKDIRNLSSEKKHIDNNMEELKEELKEYDYLEGLKEIINQIEIIKNEIFEKQELQIKIKNSFNKISDITKEKDIIYKSIKSLEDIDKVDGFVKDISSNIIKYNYLYNQNNKLSNIYNDKKININLIYSLKHLNLAEKKFSDIILKLNLETELIKIKIKLDNNKVESSNLKKVIIKSNNLNKLQDLINEIDNKSKKIDILKEIYLKESKVRYSLKKGNIYLERFINIDNVLKLYNILEDKINIFNKLQILSVKYDLNLKEIKDLNKNIFDLNESFQKDLNIYKDLLTSQETCPLCFSNIDNDKMKNIINHFN